MQHIEDVRNCSGLCEHDSQCGVAGLPEKEELSPLRRGDLRSEVRSCDNVSAKCDSFPALRLTPARRSFFC